tara:strand:- start:603 stop:1187 length:585 start_codon:yes stop_codon:yes gene_type:complete
MKNLKKKYTSLQGKFLISSPNINDTMFKKALIYIISDNENGTMGIIINKPAIKINISSILGDSVKAIGEQPRVFYGGPVELDRGFVLHTDDYKKSENFIKLDNNLALSSDISIIKDILLGIGPSKSIFAIGYTGWDSHQLQMEMKNNDWFEVDLDNEMIFSDNYKSKWKKAISKLGIDSKLLHSAIFSPYTGSA